MEGSNFGGWKYNKWQKNGLKIMRIYLKLTKNNELIPFNYQQLLTGTIHKWLGKNNDIHGNSGKFCFSWLQNTTALKDGLNLSYNAYFFISALDENIIKRIIKGIIEDAYMFCGIKVKDVQIVSTPVFGSSTRFILASPVLLKWKDGNFVRHVTINNKDFEEVLNLNFRNKLQRAGISDTDFKISLDPDIHCRKTKMVVYKGIENKASLTPIIIKGSQEQIAYAWCVGIGNSTGIGFGALK